MSRVKFCLLSFLLLLTSACSLTNPYVDRRRNAGEPKERLYTGLSTPAAPVICYNKLQTEFAELQKMADAECVKQGTGSRAEFEEKRHFVCRLLTPSYAKFKCVK